MRAGEGRDRNTGRRAGLEGIYRIVWRLKGRRRWRGRGLLTYIPLSSGRAIIQEGLGSYMCPEGTTLPNTVIVRAIRVGSYGLPPKT